MKTTILSSAILNEIREAQIKSNVTNNVKVNAKVKKDVRTLYLLLGITLVAIATVALYVSGAIPAEFNDFK